MMSGANPYEIQISCPECGVKIPPRMGHSCETVSSTCVGRQHKWENWKVVDKGSVVHVSSMTRPLDTVEGRFLIQERTCSVCGFIETNTQKFSVDKEWRLEADKG